MSRGSRAATADIRAVLQEVSQSERQFRQAVAKAERKDLASKALERKADTRRKIIVGGVLLAEARKRKSIAELLFALLPRRVEAPRDRLLLSLGSGTLDEWPWAPDPDGEGESGVPKRLDPERTDPPGSGSGGEAGSALAEMIAPVLAEIPELSLSDAEMVTVAEALESAAAALRRRATEPDGAG